MRGECRGLQFDRGLLKMFDLIGYMRWEIIPYPMNELYEPSKHVHVILLRYFKRARLPLEG